MDSGKKFAKTKNGLNFAAPGRYANVYLLKMASILQHLVRFFSSLQLIYIDISVGAIMSNVHMNLIYVNWSVCRYYNIVEADHILFIVNRERAGVEFDFDIIRVALVDSKNHFFFKLINKLDASL